MAKAKVQEKWYVGHPNEAQYRAEEKAEALVRAKDKKAMAEGNLIGRLLEVPAADGYASYVVTKIEGNQVCLKHMKWGDAYCDHYYRGGGWFPKRVIVREIKEHDDWEAILDKNTLASKREA